MQESDRLDRSDSAMDFSSLGRNLMQETEIKREVQHSFKTTQLQLIDHFDQDEAAPERNEENEKKYNRFIELGNEQMEKAAFERLLKGVSKEEREFKIVDLSSNCVYDVRNEEDINRLSTAQTKTQAVLGPKKPSWQDFWKNVTRCNNDLLDGAEIGNIEKIKYLLDKTQNIYPIDLNFPSLDQFTALHLAITDSNNDIARLLIEHGSNIEAETTFKRRPIHLCCIKGNYDGLVLLLEYKASINVQDNGLSTPIANASEKKFYRIVELLLTHGADPLIPNIKGQNALSFCLSTELYDIFKKFEPNYPESYSQQLANVYKRLQHNTDTDNPLTNSLINVGTIELQKRSVNDYDYFRILGSGSFGKVILVREKMNKKYYAMKIISKEKFVQSNLMKYAHSEKNAMNKMHHPFIVKLHHAFQSKRKLFLIQQYCGGGSLGRMLKIKNRFDEDSVRKYMCQIILAIEALHDNLIIFRDLKPDNIVLDDDGNAYLVDFGLAKIGVYDDINKSFLGTPAYLPPEIVVKEGHSRMADWYAVGIVMYELLLGSTPFNYGNVSREVLYDRIKQNSIRIPSGISANCQDLIQKLLSKSPKKRLGFKGDGKEIKEHPWFSEVNWQDVLEKKVPMPQPQVRQIPTEPLDVKFNEETERDIIVENWTEINQD